MGAIDGDAVGLTDGRVGEGVGDTDGFCVGAVVGDSVGVIVVGSDVGIAEIQNEPN